MAFLMPDAHQEKKHSKTPTSLSYTKKVVTKFRQSIVCNTSYQNQLFYIFQRATLPNFYTKCKKSTVTNTQNEHINKHKIDTYRIESFHAALYRNMSVCLTDPKPKQQKSIILCQHIKSYEKCTKWKKSVISVIYQLLP